MDEEIIEKYKREFKARYTPYASESNGALVVIATAIRGLYPVANARVDVFTGSVKNPSIIDTDMTDLSGKTKGFVLRTKNKRLSEKSGEAETPFITYNIAVKADGYVEQLNMNIPIFEGVTTLQKVDLTLQGAYIGTEPIVVYESPEYSL